MTNTDNDLEILAFVKAYVAKRRSIAAKSKRRLKEWPGANAIPFIHKLARMVPHDS